MITDAASLYQVPGTTQSSLAILLHSVLTAALGNVRAIIFILETWGIQPTFPSCLTTQLSVLVTPKPRPQGAWDFRTARRRQEPNNSRILSAWISYIFNVVVDVTSYLAKTTQGRKGFSGPV